MIVRRVFFFCFIFISLVLEARVCLFLMLSWFCTFTGDTADIPDSIMGLTFLAAGTSVPEAVSSVIVTKQGHGAMGISNSIGSNTFDILLCLGLPWFIKAYYLPAVEGENWVRSITIFFLFLKIINNHTEYEYEFCRSHSIRPDWRIRPCRCCQRCSGSTFHSSLTNSV